jgi:hypothetical protein
VTQADARDPVSRVPRPSTTRLDLKDRAASARADRQNGHWCAAPEPQSEARLERAVASRDQGNDSPDAPCRRRQEDRLTRREAATEHHDRIGGAELERRTPWLRSECRERQHEHECNNSGGGAHFFLLRT